VCRALHIIKGNYTKWPTSDEYATNAVAVEQKYGMPNVIGCIDGRHICVKAPFKRQRQLCEQKGIYVNIIGDSDIIDPSLINDMTATDCDIIVHHLLSGGGNVNFIECL